ncbi:MAG TPA: helix-turn-helix domain-containing protein [Nitriliruptorales bacterium]|nr:helix-turn-helix domain-containing protein [Nitriliruptorales bacterium]
MARSATVANLCVLKNDRARAIRFSTLIAICEALNCQPGDLLSVVSAGMDQAGGAAVAVQAGN